MRNSLKILLLACTSLVSLDASAASKELIAELRGLRATVSRQQSDLSELHAAVAQKQSDLSTLRAASAEGLVPTHDYLEAHANARGVLTGLLGTPAESLVEAKPSEIFSGFVGAHTVLAESLDNLIGVYNTSSYEPSPETSVLDRFTILDSAVKGVIGKSNGQAKKALEMLTSIDTLVHERFSEDTQYKPRASNAVAAVQYTLRAFNSAEAFLADIDYDAKLAVASSGGEEDEDVGSMDHAASEALHEEGAAEQAQLKGNPLEAKRSVDALIEQLNLERAKVKSAASQAEDLQEKLAAEQKKSANSVADQQLLSEINTNTGLLCVMLGLDVPEDLSSKRLLTAEIFGEMRTRITELLSIESQLPSQPTASQAQAEGASNTLSIERLRQRVQRLPVQSQAPVPAETNGSILESFGAAISSIWTAAPAGPIESSDAPQPAAPGSTETTAAPSTPQSAAPGSTETTAAPSTPQSARPVPARTFSPIQGLDMDSVD